MDTARYKAFITAVETGSFSRAADQMKYTPSGISQLVNALEKELNLSLLNRSQKGVSPTQTGVMLLKAMRELLQKEAEIYEIASAANGLTVGSVTIASYHSIAVHWLPEVILRFQMDHPEIQVSLIEGASQEMCSWLDSRMVEMAFMAHQEEAPYEWIPLAEDPMLAILPKQHPLAKRSLYSLADAEGEKILVPTYAYPETLPLLKKHNLVPYTLLSTQDGYGTIAMVEKGLGICIMNSLFLKDMNFDVAALPLEPSLYMTMGVAMRSLENMHPAAKQFLDYAIRFLTHQEIT